MASNIDASKPASVRAFTADVRANFAAAKSEIEALQRGLFLTPMQFGATMDGTISDQTAWNATVTAAAAQGKAIFVPAGDLVLTDTPTAFAGQVRLFGASPFKSRIIFRPTANDKIAIKLSNGASRVEEFILENIALYSDDTTYTKIAIEGADTSFCKFSNVLIYGSGGSGPSAGACWSGNSNSSIGIRTKGREVTAFEGIKIVADRPIVMAANPNTSATDGEDSDHFHFEDTYLVGNGNPCIEVDAGLGAMELTFDGYNAGVGGTGFFKINDNRSSPTVPSRQIKFKNIRYEQCTDSSKYAFDCTFADPVQQITFDNVTMATGSNGIKLDGFARAVLKQVTGAMTSTQLLVANVIAKSVLSLQGCIWQSGGTFTTTGLARISSLAYRSADYSAPSDAVYAGQITDTQVNVEQVTVTAVNTAVAWKVTGTTGDQIQGLPQAAGNGFLLRVLNNAGSDFEPLSLHAESFLHADATGAGPNLKTASTLLSAVSGATVTATSLVPDGAFVLGVTTRITTTLGTSNGTTGYNVGDGTDADRWGAITGTAAGTISTNADATANFTGAFTAANNVVLTAVGGNFDGTGAIRVTVVYIDTTAPTS